MKNNSYVVSDETKLKTLQCAGFPITSHFNISEFLKLGDHPDNLPDLQVVTNLAYGIALILEPARVEIKCPIIINSGYRNPKYNNAVGGVKNSQHQLGQAADIRPQNPTCFSRLVAVLKANPYVDQLITARSGWLHVSWNPTGTSRRQYLPNYYE